MKKLLTLFALWLMKKLNLPATVYYYPDVENDDSFKTILTLVKNADTSDGGGEFKRHNVYAKAIKLFPQIPKHRLALSIEVAVSKMKETL